LISKTIDANVAGPAIKGIESGNTVI